METEGCGANELFDGWEGDMVLMRPQGLVRGASTLLCEQQSRQCFENLSPFSSEMFPR